MQMFDPTRTMQSDSSRSSIGVRRGVESESLLVGRDGRGHALAGIAVAVDDPHAELGHGAEQGHLLGGDLAGAQEGDGVVAVGRLDLPEAAPHGRQRRVPVDRPLPAVGALQERHRGAVGGIEDAQGLPALGTGQAAIDRMVRRRREAHRLAFAEVDGQAAARGAESTHHPRGRVGRLAGRHLPQPEPARRPEQLAGQAAVPGPDEAEGAVE